MTILGVSVTLSINILRNQRKNTLVWKSSISQELQKKNKVTLSISILQSILCGESGFLSNTGVLVVFVPRHLMCPGVAGRL